MKLIFALSNVTRSFINAHPSIRLRAVHSPLPDSHSVAHIHSQMMLPSAFREHDDNESDAAGLLKQHLPTANTEPMATPPPPRTSQLLALAKGSAVRKYAVQGVFLFTGVFSTCAAQYVFYQGAGGTIRSCTLAGLLMARVSH